MLGNVYNIYLRLMGKLGQIFSNVLKDGEHVEIPITFKPPVLESPDLIATNLGNVYRGLGVLIGLFGMAIIFFALAPTGFDLDEEASHIVHYVEIVLMLLTVAIFAYVRLNDIHFKWINARLQAEIERYSNFRNLIDKRSCARLFDEITILFDDQISYNKKKYDQYSEIEKATSILIWVTFPCALLAAFAHLFLHASWLIFITAYLPALGGAIHGINGFLEIGELEYDHHLTYKELVELKKEFDKLIRPSTDYPDGESSDDLIKLADNLYDILTNNVKNWEHHIARKQSLRPV